MGIVKSGLLLYFYFMPRKHFSHYLYFTSKDRRGSLFLLVIIIIICLLPFAYPLIFKEDVVETDNYDEQLAELKSQKAASTSKNYKSNYVDEDQRPYDHPSYSSYSKANKGTLFYFDPNTISAEGWRKLGLRDKTIATIENYRNKGGKFREPGDIRKIWGLFPDEAERLIPYVKIVSAPAAANYSNPSTLEVSANTFERKRVPGVVDVNQSDTTTWIALPGIGSKLSQRIINFRTKLGGFYKVEQVAETFGLPDSVYQKIKPLLKITGEVQKIDINGAKVDELKAHPYINYQVANAIVQYRNQHGDYKSAEDIRKIMIIDDSLYSKISPYLSFQ